MRLHRQIGEVLEELHGADLESHLPQLAYHFFEGAQGGDVDKAIDYATRAGERALDLLAYEEAVGHYETALQALELKDKPEEESRCELLLALGEAQLKAGDAPKSRETFQRAADIARRIETPEQLARAALGFGEVVEVGVVDEVLIGLLEESLGILGEEDSALRAKVLARLAGALLYAASRERRASMSLEAVEMAQRVGDPAALAYVLIGRHFAMWGPENVEDRLVTATEIVRLAEEAGDQARAIMGHTFRLIDLLEMGDIPGVDVEVEAHQQLAEELRQPLYLWSTAQQQAMRALLDGRFEEGEQFAQQALVIGRRVQPETAVQQFGLQMLGLRREQGRLQEIEGQLKSFVERYPAIPGWRCALAYVYSELGRESEARREFERLAANDFADLPRDLVWLPAIAVLSVSCAFLGDADRAATLYDLLLPYAGRTVTAGSQLCIGSASHQLGLLAATMSRWEEAEKHLEDALEMNAKMGAKPWLAHTQHEYAGMLLRREGPGDREKALALVSEALDAAQELGMKALVEKALALKLQAQGIDSTAPQTSIDAVAASVYVDKPDLRQHAAPDGTVTILFSDIEGSTAITERLGDRRWLELLRAHNVIVREQVAAHEGFEVKSEGDGFMLAFQSARRGIECGVDIQRAFAERNESAREPIRVRIGLHTGEAIKEADDFFGKNVILAARIAGQAQGGEILVSSLLKELTESGGDIAFGEGREVELKGLSGQHRVFEVEWREE